MLELVDRIDLGSIGVTPREGSSPSSPIIVFEGGEIMEDWTRYRDGSLLETSNFPFKHPSGVRCL